MWNLKRPVKGTNLHIYPGRIFYPNELDDDLADLEATMLDNWGKSLLEIRLKHLDTLPRLPLDDDLVEALFSTLTMLADYIERTKQGAHFNEGIEKQLVFNTDTIIMEAIYRKVKKEKKNG